MQPTSLIADVMTNAGVEIGEVRRLLKTVRAPGIEGAVRMGGPPTYRIAAHLSHRRQRAILAGRICDGCGTLHDRDTNSGQNILRSGRNIALQRTEILAL